jgi:hypothetical protein
MALLLASIYFVLGNIIGYTVYMNAISVDNILIDIFLPYTFLWFASAMVGVDCLTVVLGLMVFIVSYGVFFPFGLFWHYRNSNR